MQLYTINTHITQAARMEEGCLICSGQHSAKGRNDTSNGENVSVNAINVGLCGHAWPKCLEQFLGPRPAINAL